MWHEADAKRGSDEISSCIYNYLMNLVPNIEHLILHSDSCGGQNKNKMIEAMFSTVLFNHATLKTIDHELLEPGHTHMECDSDHAVIERAKKASSSEIHHPSD